MDTAGVDVRDRLCFRRWWRVGIFSLRASVKRSAFGLLGFFFLASPQNVSPQLPVRVL